MASLMKQVMILFYDLSQEEWEKGNYAAAMTYSAADRLANHCHGMDRDQLLSHLRRSFSICLQRATERGEPQEVQRAWKDALEYLDVV